MKDKVWVIDDPGERPVSRDDTTKKIVRPPKEKSPAVAFSLSILFWGGGQFYNKQWKLGSLLLLLMVNFYLVLGIFIVEWESIIFLLDSYSITRSGTLLACWTFFVFGLVIWFFNARQAYHEALKKRSTPFEGVKNPFLPLICSLLIPGWGQFLNSQTKKGLFFQLVAFAGFIALPSVVILYQFWPTLEPSFMKVFLEWIFTICIVLSPFGVLMWLYGVYDAFMVCVDDLKKESFFKRMKYARNRALMQGWIRGVVPQIKLTILLSLVLIISLILGYFYFPHRLYVKQLHRIQSNLSQREMVLLPKLMDKFFQLVVPEE